MFTQSTFRPILLFVGIILACMSIASFAHANTPMASLSTIPFTTAIEYKQVEELKVIHDESVYANSAVSFQIESSHSLTKIFLYVDGTYAGGSFVHGNYAKLEMLFISTGIKQLKFIAIKDDEGNYSSYTSMIRVVEQESHRQQAQATYNPAIVYRPLAERKRMSEDNHSTLVANPNNASRNNASFNCSNSFINEMVQIIQKHVENQAIVLPTPVIVAMAALESGYGKSELATKANNFFGLKSCRSNPNDPNVYQYFKQPAEDCNLYRKFEDAESCVNFFIDELLLNKTGQWRRDYSKVVYQYQDQLKQGVDRNTALEYFIEGLVEKGYTTTPIESYKSGLMRVINTYQLYRLD